MAGPETEAAHRTFGRAGRTKGRTRRHNTAKSRWRRRGKQRKTHGGTNTQKNSVADQTATQPEAEEKPKNIEAGEVWTYTGEMEALQENRKTEKETCS